MIDTEREHLWTNLQQARARFRGALISDRHLTDAEYNALREDLRKAKAEWFRYLKKMRDPKSLA